MTENQYQGPSDCSSKEYSSKLANQKQTLRLAHPVMAVFRWASCFYNNNLVDLNKNYWSLHLLNSFKTKHNCYTDFMKISLSEIHFLPQQRAPAY